jgi:hypothetical protein
MVTGANVNSIYNDFNELYEYLRDNNQISFVSFIDENIKKTLILASASYFEKHIIEEIIEYSKKTKTPSSIIEFIWRKGLTRQYHTLFDWDSNNVNRFFRFFGNDFFKFISSELKNNPDFEESILAFLEIGRERNRMVHDDFGTYNIQKTAAEIINLHQKASNFSSKFFIYLEKFDAYKLNHNI